MIKFSIIIPVYNTEAYLEKCLQSVANQSYKNFEAIVVNDGTKDNSEVIIDKFVSEYECFVKINKQNGGLSDARNTGVEKSNGEYILFLDSDDFVDKDLLYEINKSLSIKYDLVRFGYNEVILDNTYNNLTGQDYLIKCIKNKQEHQMAWLYSYNKAFWDKNKFQFAKSKNHEDFGLIPEILLKTNNIIVVEKPLYYYVTRNDSITTTKNIEKIKKNIYDNLYHFDNLKIIIEKNVKEKEKKEIFLSYIANIIFSKINELPKNERKYFINEIKKRKIIDLLLTNTIIRKIKRRILWLKYQ